MSHEFAYPVILTPDEEDGGLVVTFEDIPEAITQGQTTAEALAQAADALEEAIAGRIRRGDPIPEPSPAADRFRVPVPAQTAAKAALYLALQETGTSKSELASTPFQAATDPESAGVAREGTRRNAGERGGVEFTMEITSSESFLAYFEKVRERTLRAALALRERFQGLVSPRSAMIQVSTARLSRAQNVAVITPL